LFEVEDQRTLANGLRVERLRVPLGVIGVVYENRPNVTTDVAGLCVRSGNAAFLRGSASAQRTNEFLVELWREALEKEGLSRDGVALVQDSSHESAVAFMQLSDVLDCLIPRGGPSLIAAMRENARVPYVLDGDGNCHIYVDASAKLDQALASCATPRRHARGCATPPRRFSCTSRWRHVPAGLGRGDARGGTARRRTGARGSSSGHRSRATRTSRREFLDLIWP
jgi:gamma-glutamyl phosphate reductase